MINAQMHKFVREVAARPGMYMYPVSYNALRVLVTGYRCGLADVGVGSDDVVLFAPDFAQYLLERVVRDNLVAEIGVGELRRLARRVMWDNWLVHVQLGDFKSAINYVVDVAEDYLRDGRK